MAMAKRKDKLQPEVVSDENVKRVIANFIQAESLDLVLEQTAEEAGLDSLDRVEMIMVMEEKFCLSLDDDIFQKETSLGEFKEAILAAAMLAAPREAQEVF